MALSLINIGSTLLSMPSHNVTAGNFNWACVLLVGLLGAAGVIYFVHVRIVYEGLVAKVVGMMTERERDIHVYVSLQVTKSYSVVKGPRTGKVDDDSEVKSTGTVPTIFPQCLLCPISSFRPITLTW